MKNVMACILGAIFLWNTIPARAERGAGAISREEDPRTTLQLLADNTDGRIKQLTADIEDLDRQIAVFKDQADLLAAANACKAVLTEMGASMKAQSAAARAGDEAKTEKLTATVKAQGLAYNKTRNALRYLGFANNYLKFLRNEKPEQNEVVAAARRKYADALKAQASFYTELAKDPPATEPGEELTATLKDKLNELSAATDKAAQEWHAQQSMSRIKKLTASVPDSPELRAKTAELSLKTAALQAAELKTAEAHRAMRQAEVELHKAESALAQLIPSGAIK